MDASTLTLHVKKKKSIAMGRLDALQMATGVLLILFLWAHMILVASVLISPKLMNAIAWFFEVTYMAQIGGPLIGMMIFVHFVVAARKMPWKISEQEAYLKHSVMMHHKDTWLWVVQVVSALVILVMASIHIWVVLTNLPITAVKSAARIQSGFWLPFYLVLLPAAELHVGIGFYRIGVKYGFISSEKRHWYQKAENVLMGVFIAVGLLTLIRLLTLPLT
ncbi:succinate dehydrogenase/fumarate reductase cytochrome b subunit [Desulfobaculum bizertense]|uniref:Succinate dehydrogenase subunit C n=1 Tax=Desulfobaculum bizertense DSM 18034 TaxID=1121442 RepID=A0A1T4WCA1_9BACT|nr:succinate dehydrogenase/fumarate reductase cytochrome b subunit [Desulfobaculum bizertense]UIJ37445.1 succinate dehydrogenase/fumarate reductase cytochrome b subunit [Desulfobaculum bizertense]SKA74807.1 succinate dehydrogenase subunit C [Desulfobaculum bizertense DSM 18034]